GVALYLRDTVPTFLNLFVSRGRAELVQRRQQAQGQVAQARALGEFAVNVGGPKVREHVEKGISKARKSAEAVITGVTGESAAPDFAPEDSQPPYKASAEPATVPPQAASGPAAGEGEGGSAGAEGGAGGYQTEGGWWGPGGGGRLGGLRGGGPDEFGPYEEAPRARRTILYKIEQLTS